MASMRKGRRLLRKGIPAAPIFCLLLLGSCATHAPVFRVVPATPDYLLRSPDAAETSFPKTLQIYNGYEPRREWMELRPKMELRIENAYYRAGAPRRGLHGFLGTEIARYRVRSGGSLRLVSLQSMKHRPKGQPPVQQLITPSQRRYRHHRFYYEIFFPGNGGGRGSVLLGADTQRQIGQLAAKLAAGPNSVCGEKAPHCTVFPEECTVSMEMEIAVNGASKHVAWGSGLADVVDHPQSIKVRRLYRGRPVPVKLDPRDPRALNLPLLPGDRIDWK